MRYLTSSRFHYQLPTSIAPGGVADASRYDALENFLFDSRTGYCQQFATAFAVLARIDALPTRVAVGFLPGTPVGHDEWNVEGFDTHAWPQVLFSGFGWIDFEPTPGVSVLGLSGPGGPSTTKTTVPVSVPTTVAPTHNQHPSTGGGMTNPGGGGSGRRNGSGGPSLPWLLFLPVAMLFWAAGVLGWRRFRLRRLSREPREAVLVAWSEAARCFDRTGMHRRRAETHVELARRVVSAGLLPAHAEEALGDLARLATSAWYGESPPGEAGARQAIADALTVVRSTPMRFSYWRRFVSVLDPRVVLV